MLPSRDWVILKHYTINLSWSVQDRHRCKLKVQVVHHLADTRK